MEGLRKRIEDFAKSINRTFFNERRRMIALLSGNDVYVSYDNNLCAAKKIKAGDTITLTTEQMMMIREQIKKDLK